METVEKIRDVSVSVTPVHYTAQNGTKTEVLKLVIPVTLIDKLGIEATRDTNQKVQMYISPPQDRIKPGDPFKLIYEFPSGYTMTSEKGEE